MSEPVADVLTLWWTAFQNVHFWWQVLGIVAAVMLATLVNRRLQQGLRARTTKGFGVHHVAVRSLQRLLWPLILLLILVLVRAILGIYALPVALLDIAMPILMALAVIRFSIYLLRKAFTLSPLLKSSENLLAAVIWLAAVLHLLGWLPVVLAWFDAIGLQMGDNYVSVLSVLKLLVVVAVAFTMALWLSEVFNGWLRKSSHISLSMQVGFSKFSRFFLVSLAFLVALNAVGINLSSLAILGGALGVGLGFGLQRIASNFISGFILVMDRSIKPGDVITVGNQFGWVEELNARYLVVRNREGVDTLIPNENMITSEVINWSYADRNVRVTIAVQISYDDDPEMAMALLKECAFASPRVLKEPAPGVLLTEFADSGITLNLMVWIADPENGTGGVKSDIHLAIWRAFKQAGITIPYPQRDLHIKSGQASISESFPVSSVLGKRNENPTEE